VTSSLDTLLARTTRALDLPPPGPGAATARCPRPTPSPTSPPPAWAARRSRCASWCASRSTTRPRCTSIAASRRCGSGARCNPSAGSCRPPGTRSPATTRPATAGSGCTPTRRAIAPRRWRRWAAPANARRSRPRCGSGAPRPWRARSSSTAAAPRRCAAPPNGRRTRKAPRWPRNRWSPCRRRRPPSHRRGAPRARARWPG